MDKDKQRQWGTVISPQSSSSGSPDSRRGDDSRSESAAKVLARDEAGERRWRVYINRRVYIIKIIFRIFELGRIFTIIVIIIY